MKEIIINSKGEIIKLEQADERSFENHKKGYKIQVGQDFHAKQEGYWFLAWYNTIQDDDHLIENGMGFKTMAKALSAAKKAIRLHKRRKLKEYYVEVL